MGRTARQKFLDEFVWATHLANMRQVFLDTAGVAPAGHHPTNDQTSQAQEQVEALA